MNYVLMWTNGQQSSSLHVWEYFSESFRCFSFGSWGKSHNELKTKRKQKSILIFMEFILIVIHIFYSLNKVIF